MRDEAHSAGIKCSAGDDDATGVTIVSDFKIPESICGKDTPRIDTRFLGVQVVPAAKRKP